MHGLKVLELGQLIAGPFAGKTLADFGADVIKVEPPGPAAAATRCASGGCCGRHLGVVAGAVAQQALGGAGPAHPEGQAVVRRLAAEADVLIENFKPGTMEGWGLGWDALHAPTRG
jgi:formyl-CoA transferase